MNYFFHKLINKRKYGCIIFFTILSISTLWGFIEYKHCSNELKQLFQSLFIIENDKAKYQLYLIQNLFYIIISTYFSTSYLGFFGLSTLVFLKGIQISFSFISLYQIQITPTLIIILLIQIILEIILLLLCFLPFFRLSLQTLIVNFYIEDNFSYKSILNYILNYIIIIIIVFILSLLSRIYLIKLF